MDVSKLYSQLLSLLDEIELRMTSPEGNALIQGASPAERERAMLTLLDVHEARLALGNAVLVSIAEKLKANEASLVAGTAAVKDSLSELNNLTRIIDAVGNLISILMPFVPMVRAAGQG